MLKVSIAAIVTMICVAAHGESWLAEKTSMEDVRADAITFREMCDARKGAASIQKLLYLQAATELTDCESERTNELYEQGCDAFGMASAECSQAGDQFAIGTTFEEAADLAMIAGNTNQAAIHFRTAAGYYEIAAVGYLSCWMMFGQSAAVWTDAESLVELAAGSADCVICDGSVCGDVQEEE